MSDNGHRSAPRRDWGTAAMALTGWLILVGVGSKVWWTGGWWLLALVPIGIVLLALAYGFGESIEKKTRSG